MVDRQDIDALLISALYGELTPADEARLQVHLESHPTDRTALEGLTLARNAVRESRILQVQIEPPQAVSAVLLQEAARRAPARSAPDKTDRESWFQRFVRSFVAHPAMAAAAMLVVVLGVAGTMYMRGEKQFAEPTATRREPSDQPMVSAKSDPAVGTLDYESKKLESNAGSSFGATLADDGRGQAAPTAPTTGADHAGAQAKLDKPTDQAANGRVADPKAASSPRRSGDTYLSTDRVEHKVKDIDDKPAKQEPRNVTESNEESIKLNRKDGFANGPRGAGSTGAGSASAPAPDAAPGAVAGMQQPPRTAPSRTVTPAPQANTVRERQNKNANDEQTTTKESEDASLLAWAREQHARVTVQVRNGNCKDATTLALQLSSKAPGYYAQNVENDRTIKTCMQYINAEREKEAERTQRARAQMKRQADEKARDAPKATAPAATDRK